MLIDNEQHTQIRNAIVVLCADLRPLGDSTLSIRIDCGPGLVALSKDPTLKKLGIELDIGNAKNVNKKKSK